MASRNSADYVNAYRRGLGYFKDHGFAPRFERIDNKSSSELKSYCRREKIQVQYVPPGNHRANQAERAIRTFKNHFIATLATLHPFFPLQHRDKPLPMTERYCAHRTQHKNFRLFYLIWCSSKYYATRWYHAHSQLPNQATVAVGSIAVRKGLAWCTCTWQPITLK